MKKVQFTLILISLISSLGFASDRKVIECSKDVEGGNYPMFQVRLEQDNVNPKLWAVEITPQYQDSAHPLPEVSGRFTAEPTPQGYFGNVSDRVSETFTFKTPNSISPGDSLIYVKWTNGCSKVIFSSSKWYGTEVICGE